MKLTLRLATLASLVVIALMMAQPALAEPIAAPADAFSFAQRVVDLTNEQRIAAGLAPLQLNDALASSAGAYAQDMASRDYFSHYSPEGASPTDRNAAAGYPSFDWGMYVGENLAKGYGSPEAVMQGWMDSEGHKRNVLLPNYIEIGVGVAVAPDGTMYWAEEFGNRPLD